MKNEEKREAIRLKFRSNVQYEKVLGDGSFSVAVIAPAKDVSAVNIGFYSQEELKLNSKLRISFSITDRQKVSYIGVIKRAEVVEDKDFKYLVGVKIEGIDAETQMKVSKFINDINIYKIFDKINLKDAIDIHFVAGYPPVVKRLSGLTIETNLEPFDGNTLKILLLSILDRDRYVKFTKEKEINFVFFYKEDIRFRVNLHIQQGNVEGTFRLIPRNVRSPNALGLPPIIEKLAQEKKGLILIAGKTGSGKTTTLSSIVDLVNDKREAIIICIEDPIEYIHTNKKSIIKHREVGRDTFSFSAAAKNALRQGPDVLIIGEILDAETMEVAITAAETGMLVLTTIHASDCSQALDRVASFFPQESQKHILSRLAFILNGVITQELVPRIDIAGLAVVSEVLVVTDAVRRVIREADWRQIATIIQTGKNQGMQSMQDSLEQYVRYGQVDFQYLKEYKK